MLVTEPSPRLPQIVAAAVAGGVDVVQWRDKTSTRTEIEAQRIGMEAASPPALLVLNLDGSRRPVLLTGSGRHWPENKARRMMYGLSGSSVHSAAAAQEAAAQGADYLVAGTIFASQSHPDIPPAGLDFLRDVCAAVSLPVLAIGGVTPSNLGLCLEAGAAGIAVLSPIMRASDPQAVALAYRAALDTYWKES
jgi:thiamine monophosphate synthase